MLLQQTFLWHVLMALNAHHCSSIRRPGIACFDTSVNGPLSFAGCELNLFQLQELFFFCWTEARQHFCCLVASFQKPDVFELS